MILTEEPRYWFYPDVNGNLQLKEEEQLAVEIIRPTGFQTKEFFKVESSREFYENDQPVDADGNGRMPLKFKSVTTEIKIDADRLLRTCVGKIKNLSVSNNGKTREIADGAQLAECRAYGIEKIVDAICAEIKSDTPSDAKKKNLE